VEPLLRVLGPLEVVREHDKIPIGGPNVRMTLALLLAHQPTVVSIDRIADAVWGDDPPPSFHTTIQGNISRLRRLLRPEVDVVARAPGYVIDLAPDDVDRGRFERLVADAASAPPGDAVDLLDRALAIWRGGAFEEFADREWARGEVARLEELRVVAIETLIEARLALGEHRAVIGELERQVIDHPLRELFWRQLMLALYRSGRQAEALRRGQELRRLMRDELGLEPSADARALETRIIEDDPTLTAGITSTVGTVSGRTASLTTATRFVGRDNDLTAIAGLLAAQRVVTLTGPGGVGKTRLAMQLAHDESSVGRAVCVVELAHSRDEVGAVQAVANALDVQQRQHLTLESTLIEHLQGRQMLVVLDNCEHLIEWVGPFVDRVRNSCAEVAVLATSREPLGLPAEHVWVVGPLDVPDDARSPDEVAKSGAAQLFLDRAVAAQPSFALTAENAPAIAEICRRVDGLPLALELAAARIRTMGPEVLAVRLEQRLDVLGATRRGAFERHNTLRAAIEWSYELLTPVEQDVFRQLTTFVGGFDLAAAEGVCAPAGTTHSVVDLVANLVDKSMVQVVDLEDARYRILETLREFGFEKLRACDQADEIGARHTAWYLDVAEQCAVGLTGPDEGASSEQLERDFENSREAHASAVARGEVDHAMRLVCALREYAFRRMRYEVTAWAETTFGLPDAEAHPRAAMALAIAAYGAFVRGDLDAAVELAGRSATMAEQTGTTSSGLAERAMGNALFYQGDIDNALAWMDRMLESARTTGSAARLTHALYMRSVAATSVGDSVRGQQLANEARTVAEVTGSATAVAQAHYAAGLACESAAPDDARTLLAESAEAARRVHNRWVESFASTEVLWLEAQRGNPLAALAGYASVVETWYRGGDWANQWLSLRHVCGIFAHVGEHRSAAVLYGAIAAAGAAIALPFEPSDAERLGGLVGELRTILGAAEFAAAVREGAATRDVALVQFVQDEIRRLTAG
jgi:predicted ATPase/DNA-binding SARP family transcriptional activator